MILCQCHALSKDVLHAAVEACKKDLATQNPQMRDVWKYLGKKPCCSGCIPHFRKAIGQKALNPCDDLCNDCPLLDS